MSTETKPKPTTAIATVPASSLDFYRRIADPIEAVHKLGIMFAESKMFNCKNDSQGRVLAMACLAEHKSPIELMREYHLIDGNLTMKADVMLAKFRAAGGEHSIIERSADRAAIELKMKRHKCNFAFTWEEAKAEAYVYGKDGKSFKDNWATPRRRKQMLWARLISDAVRAMAPECIAGHYTPEDLGHHEADVITVEAEPATQGAEDKAIEEAATKAAAAHPAMEDRPPPDKVSREQLVEMKRLKIHLNYDGDTWRKILEKFDVATAKDLDTEEAARLLLWLHKQADKEQRGNELEQWANDQIPS